MKNVLIIGASSSLGELVVKNFSKASHKIVATYSSTKKNFKNIDEYKLDLTSNKSINDFSSFIINEKVKFDICIFLSGYLPGKSIEDYTNSELEDVININFLGFAKTFKKILPSFQNNSQLLVVSSISGQRGSYDPVYAASKGALISFMKSIATASPLKIRANAIAPGLIENTSMFNDMKLARQKFHIEQSPTKKLTNKEDLSKIILDITKPHWSNMNGAIIQVNGGTYV